MFKTNKADSSNCLFLMKLRSELGWEYSLNYFWINSEIDKNTSSDDSFNYRQPHNKFTSFRLTL
jgi:hypothetical protein